MSIDKKYIQHLVFKFNKGDITPEELQALINWYNSHNDELVVIPSKESESVDEAKSRILAGLLSKIAEEQPLRIKRYYSIRWVAAAAAVVLLALGTWVVLDDKAPAQGPNLARGIEPGGNKATLTLSDGRTIELSTSQSGIVTGEAITYANGTPVENIAMDQSGDVKKLMSLHTPRGGTYKVILPDGTQVWLNAASTIKYPLRFSSEERVVQLEGEAYFHVTSAYRKNGQKMPFKVISNRQEVEVLGTQFNMNAYPEQLSSKTTLVEGKVAVSDKQKRFVLQANEQAVTTTAQTRIKPVHAGNYTAWRDGKFSFDDKTFEETMFEIGRWYDLDIVYENGVPQEELTGDAFRNQNIRFVLRLLDVAEIDYKLDVAKRKLTIKGNKR